MTQYSEEELIKDFFNRGASAYVIKGSEPEVLTEAIRGVNKEGIYKENLKEILKKAELYAKQNYYKHLYSRREREISALLCQGKSVSEMAIILSIDDSTIESHLTKIYRKASVNNMKEFLIYAIREGLNYMGTQQCGE